MGSQRVGHDWVTFAFTFKCPNLYGLPRWLKRWRICLQCGRPGFNPWVGKILWRNHRLPLQYSGLENSMDCIVYGVAKSWTWLSDFHSLAFIWSKIGWPHISALSAKRDIWKHEKEESVYPIGYLINNHILTTIIKEINPEYSLEGLMLQLKLQ